MAHLLYTLFESNMEVLALVASIQVNDKTLKRRNLKSWID